MATKKISSVTKVNKLDPVNVKADPVEKAASVKATEPAKATKTVKTEPAKKAEPAKKTAKKTTTKRATAKKEIKVNTFIQYLGKQVEEKTLLAAIKKSWTKAGNKVGDIKSVEMYIKPEDDMVYYVVNGTEKGSVPFEE